MSFKRRVLSALGKDVLLEIGRGLELDVTSRTGIEELRDALAKSKRAKLDAIVQESLSRDTLKDICGAVGLDATGKEKATLVERILAAGGDKAANGAGYRIDPDAVRGSKAAEGGGALGALRSGLDAVPAKMPPKAKGKTKKGERRRGGVPESEAVIAGTLKAALQQFALVAAGGYSGAGAHVAFTTHLLECFGWSAGRPESAAIPHTFAIVEAGKRVEREVALWWPERRTLLEVAGHDAGLDFAWKDLVRVCLQVDPIPQYVVLTNQRDLQLYDLARDREAPRLAIRIDDLPKYSEAFPFFSKEWTPGAVPRIVNVEKVSEDVADLVARLYRSVRAQHTGREKDVIRFTLQCITAMFAEDIGLLPKSYFTSLLYDGARSKDIERRLHELFTQMNTRDLPAPRVVPFFNGGLFTDVTTLPLGDAQLMALTKAAEANWTFVDPHIFGSVFQGIMDDVERHASGAHYTAHDDIMRVVGPTIVESWRKRIAAATSLKQLTELRRELFAFRVLDPACGSGNFLYVAFRELYRLDTELLLRMREFPSTAGKLSWNGGISAVNFYGIDINPFAVELAKVTLNIAKKIAFEERKAQAFALAGQVEMDIDPSLPLDNLDQNIVCADALFTEWPEVDAIVGNPPFLGGLKIRSELGEGYLARLQERFPSVNTREAATNYIVQNGGTIVNAVSSQPWPGLAVVNVSMVNWVKGTAGDEPRRLVVDGTAFEPKVIPSLTPAHDRSRRCRRPHGERVRHLARLGAGHESVPVWRRSRARHARRQARARKFIKPVAVASHLLRGQLDDPEYVIDMSRCDTEQDAKQGGAAYDYIRKHVYTVVREKAETTTTDHYKNWLRTWWRRFWPRLDFLAQTEGLARIIVCSRHAARPIFVFMSRDFFPTESLQLFGFADDYSFGVLQSCFHWTWAVGVGSKIKEDTRYTGEVWETFPWSQEPTETQVSAVAAATRALRQVRKKLMNENDWSLRDLYQSAEGASTHPLNDAQAALDATVADAYGMPPDQGPTEFLLELNQLVAEDEEQGRKVRGPGLPDHLDPKDPRWFSTDCIEPPPVGS